MHQLDILISEHQRESADQMKKTKLQLQLREEEVTTLRISLRERTDQVRTIHVPLNHESSTNYVMFFLCVVGAFEATVTSAGAGA